MAFLELTPTSRNMRVRSLPKDLKDIEGWGPVYILEFGNVQGTPLRPLQWEKLKNVVQVGQWVTVQRADPHSAKWPTIVVDGTAYHPDGRTEPVPGQAPPPPTAATASDPVPPEDPLPVTAEQIRQACEEKHVPMVTLIGVLMLLRGTPGLLAVLRDVLGVCRQRQIKVGQLTRALMALAGPKPRSRETTTTQTP